MATCNLIETNDSQPALASKPRSRFGRWTASLIAAVQAHPDRAGVLAVVLLVMLALGNYWLKVDGQMFLVGNDFDCLYYRYRAYQLDTMVREHRIPLWSPAEGAGYPFYCSPFTAAFYPLNLPSALFYQWTGAYTRHDHQVFAVLGVILFSLGLYAWLRSLRLPVLATLFAAVTLGTSMKITEIMRFPNAVHTAAWIPWILWGLTLAMRRDRAWRGMLLIAGATVMMITAGYPYFVYYSQFLIGPYVLLMLFGRTRSVLMSPPDDFCGVGRAVARIATAFAVAGALCLPYACKMQAMLAQTQDRDGRDFAYSTAHEWTWTDTLGSLTYPPAAMGEGWYYFGAVGLLILLVYIAWTVGQGRQQASNLAFIGILVIWWLILTRISMSASSPLFVWLWHHWPGFASLRVWPRMNILLVMLLAWLLARACAELRLFTTEVGSSSDEAVDRGRPMPRRLLLSLAVIYAVVAGLQWGFVASGYTSAYYAFYFAPAFERSFARWWFPLCGSVAFAAIGMLLWLKQRGKLRSPAAAAGTVAVLLIIGWGDVGPLGTTQWGGYVTRAHLPRSRVHVPDALTASLATPRRFQYDTMGLQADFNSGIVQNWYFGRYTGLLDRSGLLPLLLQPHATPSDEGKAVLRLLGVEDGRRLYFLSDANHQHAVDLLADADKHTDARVDVLRYNGDVLEVDVQSEKPGYVCFVDNWDPDWRATVDGESAECERVLGTFKCVAVPAGQRRVRFAYQPWGIFR